MSKMVDFRHKEVINICDAKRLGYVCDVDIDLCTGTVNAIVVPGSMDNCLFPCLSRRGGNIVIPWDKICRIGEEVILVEI